MANSTKYKWPDGSWRTTAPPQFAPYTSNYFGSLNPNNTSPMFATDPTPRVTGGRGRPSGGGINTNPVTPRGTRPGSPSSRGNSGNFGWLGSLGKGLWDWVRGNPKDAADIAFRGMETVGDARQNTEDNRLRQMELDILKGRLGIDEKQYGLNERTVKNNEANSELERELANRRRALWDSILGNMDKFKPTTPDLGYLTDDPGDVYSQRILKQRKP